MKKEATDGWTIPSNDGRTNIRFVVQRKSADNIIGSFELVGHSVEEPEEAIWTFSLGPLAIPSSKMHEIADALDAWIVSASPFAIEITDGETRAHIELRTQDELLILGPGHAGLHFSWNSIGILNAEVACVIDESCVRPATKAIHRMLNKTDITT